LRPLFSRKGSKRDWLKRWEFWNSALSRHNIRTDRIPAEVPDLRTGAMAVWSQYAGDAIMGEKSPDYYDSLQEVAREFPNARFIILWRDPADICRSMIRARAGSTFFSKPGILHRALIGYSRMRREQLALQAQGVALHEVQYEELVQNPVKVMTGVSEFLGIPFDPRMASLRGADRSAIYVASHHNQVRVMWPIGRNSPAGPGRASRNRAARLPAFPAARKFSATKFYFARCACSTGSRYSSTATRRSACSRCTAPGKIAAYRKQSHRAVPPWRSPSA
jgi:hypothetical protein